MCLTGRVREYRSSLGPPLRRSVLRCAERGSTGSVLYMDFDSEKALWSKDFPQGESLKDELAYLVERDVDDPEQSYYESASDPQYVAIETERRRLLGQLRRRLRRRR